MPTVVTPAFPVVPATVTIRSAMMSIVPVMVPIAVIAEDEPNAQWQD
jgi:hypothetical protein